METKEKIEDDKHAIDDLFHRSLQFRNTEEYLRFFGFIGKILHYSHYNATLVYMQNKNVKYFGTPGFWKKTFNRTVNKNARPYVIIIPFGPATLAYSVDETTGKLSPEEFIEKGFNGELFQIKGDIPEELLKELKRNLAEYKIYVNEKIMPFNKGGETYDYSIDKIKIDISKSFTPAQAFASLIHELAHNFLGHMGEKILTRESVFVSGKNKGKTKIETINIVARDVNFDMREIEAETVSYVVCSRWNLEFDPKRYISSHITERNIKNISPETIIRVADEIENYFLKRFK
jgi:hypothetical protein